MAREVDPADKNAGKVEMGDFNTSETGAGVQQFGNDVDNSWLIVGGILALIFFS